MTLTPVQQAYLLNLARAAIVSTLQGRRGAAPVVSDPELSQAAGCFVTLHETGSHRLRGCIGRIQSSDPLVIGVYESAVSVLADPRFRSNPVLLAELPRLDLEVSVLSPLAPAGSTLDFDPATQGIFLSHQGRTGTFLPQVARDTGWNRQQLLEHLCADKMGLSRDAWQDPAARLFTYTTGIIGPVPFVERIPATTAGSPGATFIRPAVAAAPSGFGAGNRFVM